VSNSWLPTWFEVLLTAVFCVVLAVHGAHAVLMAGRSRWWHGAHVLMALGMVDMYWPGEQLPVGAGVGKAIFGVAAVVVLLAAAVPAVRGPGVPWLWLGTAIGLGAMAYTFVMTSTRYLALTWVLVAWFAVEAVAWSAGPLVGIALRSGLVLDGPGAGGPHPGPDPRPGPDVEPRLGRSRVAARPSALLAPPLADRQRAVHARSVRITLAVMAAGMALMLLAMQYGMTVAPTGGGMPGMPGM